MLFPNVKEPTKALFNLEIAKQLTKFADIRVIAPVRILPFFGIKNIPAIENINGIQVYHPRVFLPPKLLISLHGLIYFWSIKKLIQKITKAFNFDIILSPYLFPDGFAGVLLGKQFNKPVVLEALGCDVNLLTKLLIRSKLIKYACLLSDKVICVSQDMKKTLVSFGVPADKIPVIYNGVDKTQFKLLDKVACRKQLLLPQDKIIFLFVGNLEEVKGIFTLLSAWKQFAITTGKDSLLVLVGDGKEKIKAERFIKQERLNSSVLLVGSKAHSEIPVWMNSSDIFCLPSIREGYPNVLVEALSCGKFVIATNVGGIPEIITSQAQGLLIPPSQPGALKEAFDKALQLQTLARSITETVISWEKSTLQRYQVFQEIIQKTENK